MDEHERRSARTSLGTLLATATIAGLLGGAGAVWLRGGLEKTAARLSRADLAGAQGSTTGIVTLRSEIGELRERLEREAEARRQLARQLHQPPAVRSPDRAMPDTPADGTDVVGARGPGAGQRDDASPAAIEVLRSEIRALRARLGEEATARRKLAHRLTRRREGRTPNQAVSTAERGTFTEPAESADTAAAVPPIFDETALAALGASEGDSAWLHRIHDSFTMKQLDLVNQATREGWLSTPRFAQEQGEQLASLKAELGDEVYDLLLYGAGNRVIVGDVVQSSPADQSGIRAGDVIWSYGGRRVLNAAELRAATAEGKRGESVAVEILRGGRTENIFVPRGPLGVRVNAAGQPAVDR